MTTDEMDDVIARWNEAKLKHRSAPVYEAGDALAAELQSCRARIAELEAALKPFADAAKDPVRIEGSDWPVRHLRREHWDAARAALADSGEAGE